MINMLKKIVLLMGVSFTMSLAYADDTSEKLTQLLKNMHSMQADFVQTVQDRNGKALQKSTGQMSLQRPNQFRWDVKIPNKQLIVTNGKRLWIYDPDLEQVTIRSLVKTAGETPAMLLSDENLSLGDEYSISPGSDSSALEWFDLVPKDKSSMISSLKLGFLKQEIHQMLLQDHLGHMTKIEFKNIVKNKPLSASLFNFKAPAGVDVIDETKKH